MNNNNCRLAELDGLRGVAALGVVLFHYIYHYNTIYGHSFSISEVFKLGYFGVHLFFMISGFVIYWSLSRTKKPIDFIWSRFTRLYPVFWVALIITFITISVFTLPGRESDFIDFLFNFTMLQEYLGYKNIDGVYWTLTLEITFYFWLFLIFILGQIKNLQKILIFWILLALTFNYHENEINISDNIKNFLLLKYISFFAAGICFYKYRTNSWNILTHLILFLVAVSIFAIYSIKYILVFTVFFVIFALVINDKASIFKNKYLTYFGSISYPLYLIHQNIGYVIINYSYTQNLRPFLGLTAAFLVSLILSHMLLRLVERPSMRFLKKKD